VPAPTLTPQLFAILRAVVEERTGLHYDHDNQDLFAERVFTRVHDRGFDSPLDYYYHLRYDDADGAEMQRLADALVVNETYFFRELDQLEVAADLLAERARAGKGQVRAWSAACATGEEPLSLAMLLDARGALDRVELVASDISTRALERARSGRYGPRSIRSAPPRALERWIERDGATIIVRPELVARIRWLRWNLVDPPAHPALGPFDVILCRNALIYFTDERVAKVVEGLVQRLLPGGALFVGVSESLMRLRTTLSCEERGGIFYYRRPA
jgi:chemotaxis protein methyltransferase CheR